MELIVEDAEFVTMAAGAGPAEAMLVRAGCSAAPVYLAQRRHLTPPAPVPAYR